jgi:hypothetical protein
MSGASLDDAVAHVRHTAGADPLDRMDAAMALAAALTARADAVVDHFVAEARSAGLSWTEIGARLGVSKQAARKRFADRAPMPALEPGHSMRPRLAACLDRAHEIARADGSAEVGTHHLLAGLLADGVAAAILERLGVCVDAVSSSAARLFGPPPPPSADRPPVLSAEAVFAVDAAARQATAGDPDAGCVGTEHLLAVLALDPGSRARRVLVDLGVDLAAMKKELDRYVDCDPGWPRRLRRPRARRGPACSFCGTAEAPRRPLVRGSGVAICGACAARAAETVDAHAAGQR